MLHRPEYSAVLSSKDFCRSQALKNEEIPVAVVCSEGKPWSAWRGRAWHGTMSQGFLYTK